MKLSIAKSQVNKPFGYQIMHQNYLIMSKLFDFIKMVSIQKIKKRKTSQNCQNVNRLKWYSTLTL